MFNRIPFAGTARIVGDRDRELVGIAKFGLQQVFPSPCTVIVGSSTIRQNHEPFGMGVEMPASVFEPVYNTIYRKLRGIAGISDSYRAPIVQQVEDAIRNCLESGIRREVMIVDLNGLFAPDGARGCKPPDEFFFLGIHTDDTNPLGTTLFNQRFDPLELLIPPRRGDPPKSR